MEVLYRIIEIHSLLRKLRFQPVLFHCCTRVNVPSSTAADWCGCHCGLDTELDTEVVPRSFYGWRLTLRRRRGSVAWYGVSKTGGRSSARMSLIVRPAASFVNLSEVRVAFLIKL